MSETFEIAQPAKGYRYSLDPFLLADFILDSRNLPTARHEQAQRTAKGVSNGGAFGADLGTGNGILPLLLKRHIPGSKFTGIDIRYPPLRSAKKNLPSSSFLQADLRDAANLFRAGSFDIAVSNPPYRKKGSGRINISEEKAVSRHELKLTLRELAASAGHLLRDGGVFYICHLAERSGEVLSELESAGLITTETCFVRSKSGEEPFLYLSCAVKGGGEMVFEKPPVSIYGADSAYSEEMDALYRRLSISGSAE